MAKQHYFFSTTENFTKPLVKKPAIQDTVKQYTENNVNVNADKGREGETGAEEGKTDLRKLPSLDQDKEKTKSLPRIYSGNSVIVNPSRFIISLPLKSQKTSYGEN